MTKRRQMNLVNRIAKKVIAALDERKGFDFRALDEDIQAEIVGDLTIIVYDELKKAGAFE